MTKPSKWVPSWSIRTQLMLLLLAALLPALVIILVNGFELKDSKMKEAHERSLNAARSLASQQDQIAKSTKQILSTLARMPQIRKGHPAACDSIFRDLVSQNPAYLIFSIATPGGVVFASSHPSRNYSVADRRFFQEAIRSKKFSAGEYVVGKASGLPSFHFAYPILTTDGRIRAVLIAALNLNVYKQWLSDEYYIDGYVMGLTDHRGIRLYRYPDTESEVTGVGVAVSDVSMKNFFRPGEEGLYEGGGSDGTYRLYAYKKMRIDDDTPPYGYIFVGANRDAILAGANGALYRNLIFLGVTLMIALIVAWAIGNISFVNRLQKLKNAAHQLAEGDLRARAGLPRGHDEISDLASSFDDMSAALERNERERRQAEQEIRESRRQLAEIIEFLPDATLILDRDGKVIAWNRAIEAMTGVKTQDMLGKGDYEHAVPFYGQRRPILIDLALHPDPEMEKNYTTIRKRGDTVFGESFVPALPTGYAHLSATATVLRDENGDIVAAIECIRDNTERKQAEEALEESERRYREIIENVLDVYYRTDQKGNMIMMSPSGAQILGYETAEKIVGKNAARDLYLFPEDRDRLLSRIIDEGQVRDYEVTLKRKDGTPIQVSTSSRFYYGRDGSILGVEGFFRDITERKRTEEELKKTRELEKSILSSVPHALFGVEHRRIFFANDAMETIFGWKPEELIGQSTRALFRNDGEWEKYGETLYTMMSKHSVVSFEPENPFVRKDGTEIYCRNSVSRIGESLSTGNRIVATFEDITERKRIEETLRENEILLREMQKIARLGGWKANPQTDYLKWSEGVYEIVEAPPDYSPGLTEGVKYYPPKYIPVIYDSLKRCLEEGKPFSVESEVITETGKLLWAEIRGLAPLADGQRSFVLGTIQDITERKNAEMERKALEERLNRAEKMEALGLLAGGVAHDLNNVLGILVGYSELIADEIEPSSPLRPHVEYMKQGGERAAAIVQDLLALARRGVQAKDIVDLNTILDDVQKSPEFEKIASFHPNVRVELVQTARLLNIKGSPVHLRKTILNLISNAMEAMVSGGQLTVRTDNQYLDGPVPGYDDIQEGDYVVLSVADTGEGISESDMKRIFEPFYTKKVMGRSGTGLGLAVVWGTVKDQNGYINVQSEEGKGSTFTLYFPVTREEAAREQETLPKTAYMGNGESILVVDDIQGQRELASKILSKLNYRIETAASGEEAVEYLKEHCVDLLVLDMIMDPGIDGLETYRRIKGIHPAQKAIIVSGFSESDRIRQAQVLGAGAYVRKPYDKEVLGMAVRKELDRSK